MAPPRLTISGFCRKDVYESLERAIHRSDVRESCCLAVELACTPKEKSDLVAFLIDIFAQFYVNDNVWMVRRIANMVSAALSDDRGALCELVVLLATSPRRNTSDAHMDVSGRESAPSSITPSTDDLFRLAKTIPADLDEATRTWVILSMQAKSEFVARFVEYAHTLFRHRLSKARLASRMTLLRRAIVAVAKDRVRIDEPEEVTQRTIQTARSLIDLVFDEILAKQVTTDDWGSTDYLRLVPIRNHTPPPMDHPVDDGNDRVITFSGPRLRSANYSEHD